MTSLDEEFARFQEELSTLEKDTTIIQDSTSATSKDESIENSIDQNIPNKRVKLNHTTSKPVEKPQVIIAPPRPAPIKKSTSINYNDANSVNGMSQLSAPLIENHTMHQGALSGFPSGTSGASITYTTVPFNSTGSSQSTIGPRIDMTTGQLLSIDEQQKMNMQQSAYEYNPNRIIGSHGNQSNGNTVFRPPNAKRKLRMAGGTVWEDQTLADWPDNDFRLFCGDLGNEVSDELLAHSFSRYDSFQRARVVRDKHTHKSKGYGFVSFADAFDCVKALREMNGKYIGNRPVKLSKSKWEDRNLDVAKKKAKKKKSRHLFQ